MNKKIKTLIFVIILTLSYRFISSFTTSVIIGMKMLDSTTKGIEVTNDMAANYFSDNSNIIGLVGITANMLFIWFMFFAKQLKIRNYLNFKKIDFKLILRLICYSLILQEISMSINKLINYWVPLDEYMLQMRTATSSDNHFITLIIVGILAPIVEEVFFRGIIFTKLKNKINIKWAILIQALLFATIHMNLAQFSSCFILGIIAAFLYVRYDSMLAPIALHVSFNSFAVLMDCLGDYSGVVFYLLLGIATLYVGYYYYINRNHKTLTLNHFQ